MENEVKLSRDNTISIVVAIIVGAIIGIVSGLYIKDYELFASIVTSVFVGFLGTANLKRFNLQNAQEGTPQSMKNKWKSVLVSFSFWLCPIVSIVLTLLIK